MNICRAKYLLWLVIATLGTVNLLASCGQKGPLYLPDETPTQKQPQDKKPQDSEAR